MIAVIDYGVGNLRSVEKALQAVGGQVERLTGADSLSSAEKVVLPGVGSFRDGMEGLKRGGFLEPLEKAVQDGIPLLGICLGMQLLFDIGEEHGEYAGLGFLRGRVRRFETTALKVPQTGWNRIHYETPNPILAGVPSGAYAYFNHSFYCQAEVEDTLGWTEYGIRYSSMVARDNLYGMQFHPEKSQRVGLSLLRNFVERC